MVSIMAVASFVAILVTVTAVVRPVVFFNIAIALVGAQSGKFTMGTAAVLYTIVPAMVNRIVTIVTMVRAPKTASSINDPAACLGLLGVVIRLKQCLLRHAIGRR